MKKFLVLGLTALGLALVTDRPADAWINSKFSVGFNWHWQSGGNSLLWGAFRNSQPPGPDHGGGPGYGYGPGLPYGGHGATFPGFNLAAFMRPPYSASFVGRNLSPPRCLNQ